MATESEHGLCHDCWSGTEFLTGQLCDTCGVPLPEGADTARAWCDGCLHAPPAWQRGRAAVRYAGAGRKLVLALKHGDRQDLRKPMARWMSTAGRDLLDARPILVPVPLHWRRFLGRTYNQAALLAGELAKLNNLTLIPDLLLRQKPTRQQVGMTREERQINQEGAFRLNSGFQEKVTDARLLLIDDVLTSGATLSACSEVCLAAGAKNVDILAFARVATRQ